MRAVPASGGTGRAASRSLGGSAAGLEQFLVSAVLSVPKHRGLD